MSSEIDKKLAEVRSELAAPVTTGPRFVREQGALETCRVPPTTPLWRYQDLANLLWTLENKSLWFARADTLGDPFEGSVTKHFHMTVTEVLRGVSDERAALEQFTRINRSALKNGAVNCWHASDHESAAMWRLYADQGIAMRSSVQRLIESIPVRQSRGADRDPTTGIPNVMDVEFGPVSYIDHFTEPHAGPWLPTQPLFRKHKSFEHEREFRAVIYDLPITSKGVDADGCIFPDGGVAVPVVDLEKLIERIYVSPGAPTWFKEVVAAAVMRFGGGRFEVKQSDLDRDPIF